MEDVKLPQKPMEGVETPQQIEEYKKLYAMYKRKLKPASKNQLIQIIVDMSIQLTMVKNVLELAEAKEREMQGESDVKNV